MHGAQRARPFERWSWQAAELVAEIVATAEQIASARAAHAECVMRADGTWRVLVAVDRSRHCLSSSDLARALRIRRQAAHALVHEAARAGFVELEPSCDDRRMVLVTRVLRVIRERLVRAAPALARHGGVR